MKFNNFNKPPQEKILQKRSNIITRLKILAVGFLVAGSIGHGAMAETNNLSKDEGINKKEKSKDYDSNVTKSENKIEFSATNFFEPDSDVISPEAINEICLNFQKLLDQINEDNYNKVLEYGVIVAPGADPNLSVQFKNNEELATARAKSLIAFLDDYLQKANFPNLDAEKIKNLKEKIQFIIEIPVSQKVDNPQIGVIYPEDLGYTEQDLDKMDKSQIEEIYKACRVVTVSLGLEIENDKTYRTSAGDFINPMQEKGISKVTTGGDVNLQQTMEFRKIKMNWNAEYIGVIIDNSPSMNTENGKGKSHLVTFQKLKEDPDLEGKKIHFAFFSDKLGEVAECNDINELNDKLKNENFKGNIEERAASSSVQFLDQMPNNKNFKIFKVITDENLQGMNTRILEQIEENAINKNVDVKFYYINSEKKEIEISLEELRFAVGRQLIYNARISFRDFLNTKRNDVLNDRKNSFDKERPIIDKKTAIEQLDNLQSAVENYRLNEVLDNIYFAEVFKKTDKNEAKNLFLAENIPYVKLTKLGHEVILPGN